VRASGATRHNGGGANEAENEKTEPTPLDRAGKAAAGE